MKYVLLAFFVLFAAQPLQATFCDMHGSQGTSHGQHGVMNDSMDGDMDCCDHDAADSLHNCDSMSHCGASYAGAATIDSTPVNVAFAIKPHQHLTNTGHPLNRFYSPPFRPPIA
jgi:hypothetical protein